MKSAFILFLTLVFTVSKAQMQLFKEGVITYEIYINNMDKSVGEFIIMQKGDLIKQTMKLNGAITSVRLHNNALNESVIYSNTVNGNYATRLNAKDLELKNKKFENAQYVKTGESKTIAGYNGEQVKVTYADGSTNLVFAAKEMKSSIADLNAMFNGILGLPLQYEIQKGGNNKLVLLAKSITITPVDKKEMEPLKGYRFLTVTEMTTD